jgi:hypothetical protein
VSRWIVAAEIRKIGGQPVRIGHHDFYAVAWTMPESLGAERQAEFERHIEAWKVVLARLNA